MRVGILTEYPSPAVQSGPAIHTKFLYEGLGRRGHDVMLIGPDTGSVMPIDGPETQLFHAVSYPTHPNVKIPLPRGLRSMYDAPRVDVIHGQTNSHMIHYGVWVRELHGIPLLNTHTIHLPTHSHFILSDKLYGNPMVREVTRQSALGMEKNFARLYNQGDCLIVQSRYFVDYWRERGVTVPIEVVGRPINPTLFSAQPGEDPFPTSFKVGKRLLVVCRHDREKSLDHLIDLFVSRIAPNDPEATLTLVGDGHHHANLVMKALATPYAARIHFPGEVAHGRLVDWYAHADVFVYTSVSETFGNVVNEALWTGLPVVALDDRMGVAHQIAHEINGYLVEPERHDTDDRFAAAVLRLTGNRNIRRRMAEQAATLARRVSHPDVVLSRFERIYEDAKRHCRETLGKPLRERSHLTRVRSFTRNIGAWTWYNSLLLTLAHTATRLGASRTGDAAQHEAVMAEVAAQAPAAATSNRAARERRPAA